MALNINQETFRTLYNVGTEQEEREAEGYATSRVKLSDHASSLRASRQERKFETQ